MKHMTTCGTRSYGYIYEICCACTAGLTVNSMCLKHLQLSQPCIEVIQIRSAGHGTDVDSACVSANVILSDDTCDAVKAAEGWIAGMRTRRDPDAAAD